MVEVTVMPASNGRTNTRELAPEKNSKPKKGTKVRLNNALWLDN